MIPNDRILQSLEDASLHRRRPFIKMKKAKIAPGTIGYIPKLPQSK